MSPALAGRFSTTAPPGKSLYKVFKFLHQESAEESKNKHINENFSNVLKAVGFFGFFSCIASK